MKNAIVYYYNLEPVSIHQKDKNYFFSSNNEKYYLLNIENYEETDKIYSLAEQLSRYLPIHKIILNKENKTYTMIGESYYTLMKVIVNKSPVTILQLLESNSILFEKNDISWGSLWSEKIDFFEYQMNQMGKEYSLLVESFSYFVGLAENAILLFNTTNVNKIPISLSHKRITNNSSTYDLYNPFNLIVDYRVRDICDYINSCFFEKKDVYKLVDDFLEYNILSDEEKCIFFSRILFPTYYFDLFEKILYKLIDKEEIKKIISNVSEYERFLLYISNKINEKKKLFDIEWLKKIMQY